MMKIRIPRPVSPPITRAELEYPITNVSFAYLASINKVLYSGFTIYSAMVLTRDRFTDGSVIGVTQVNSEAIVVCRASDRSHLYYSIYNTYATASDHGLRMVIGDTTTYLAEEAIDLDKRGRALRISCAGSIVKSMRYELPSPIDPLSPPTPGATISATDTTYVEGLFGYRLLRDTYPHGYPDPVTTYLIPPGSPGPEAVAIVEAGITGSGSPDDPYRPALAQELVEVDLADPTIPEFLKHEKRKYDLLKAKGFTDEEIRLLLGYIPQHQINKLAITWGAIDFRSDPATGKPIAPTYLIAVYDDPEKTLKHIEYARGRNMKVYTPPFDLDRVKVIHRIERRDRDWLITENELAYQVLGREDLEVEAVADFYQRELLDLGRIKDVKEWILEETLAMWEERARRYGRDQALEKLKRVRRR
jgi:hypothetical protein